MKVSVAMLTFNGGLILRESLRMLMTQQLQMEMEIVAVDSGSNDGTAEYLAAHGVKLYHSRTEPFRFGPARDFLFSQCSGDIIITLSQDVVLQHDTALAQLVEPILTGEADVVQGKTKASSNRNVFVWHRDSKVFYFTGEATGFTPAKNGVKLSCECMALRRDAWEATRFGDAPFCEDKAIQARLARRGFRVLKIMEPLAWHDHEYSLRTLAVRCHNEGVGWRYAGCKYTMPRFLWDLLSGPFRFRRKMLKAFLSGEANDLASILFFQIRPCFLFLGDRFHKQRWF